MLPVATTISSMAGVVVGLIRKLKDIHVYTMPGTGWAHDVYLESCMCCSAVLANFVQSFVTIFSAHVHVYTLYMYDYVAVAP